MIKLRLCFLLTYLVGLPVNADQRPSFHFTPQENWINDPNGMVYHQGNWHLFYQYNPQGDRWGHMSWGHAISRDLIDWKHLPVAIPERGEIMAFSGSAVVDWENTSGFGEAGKAAPLVAIYTGHQKDRQDQRLAYSKDGGKTWLEYENNPVLDIGMADFRDPKVFWDKPRKQWVMILSLSTEKKVSFYTSPDLKSWEHASDFGPEGAVAGIWECPDLFELPVDGYEGESKWVILLNLNPGGYAGGSGCQYFVGDFDGKHFILDNSFPSPEEGGEGVEKKVYADFEGEDFGNWVAEGASFNGGPDRHVDGDITGFVGQGFLNSFGGSDENTGTLKSPEFAVDTEWIAFRIGGGHYPERMGLRLLVDGKIVRDATGNHSPHMMQQVWDTKELQGKNAVLEVYDDVMSAEWGHITVDHIIGGDGLTPQIGETALWADYGPDFYAAVSWSDVPQEQNRRVAIAWMSNWAYAEKTPTSPWRGSMTLPRELSLRKTESGYRLIQRPIREISQIARGGRHQFPGGTIEQANRWLQNLGVFGAALDVSITLDELSNEQAVALVLDDTQNGRTLIGWKDGKLFVDRTKSGQVDFDERFPGRYEVALGEETKQLSFRFIHDQSTLEVFAQDGAVSLTQLIYPKGSKRRISLLGNDLNTKVSLLNIQPLTK